MGEHSVITTRIKKLKVEHFRHGIPNGDGHTWLATDVGASGKYKPIGVGHTEAQAIADLEEFLLEEFLCDMGFRVMPDRPDA